MKNNLIVVFNICGLGNPDTNNFPYYISSLHELLEQDLPDVRIVLSSCMSTPSVLEALRKEFGDRISYSMVKEVLTVNTTFNYAVMRAVEEFGRAPGYMYIDSGISTAGDKTVFSRMFDCFTNHNAGMVASHVSEDSGFRWWGINPSPHKVFKIPLGKTVNLHCQIFHDDIYENFNGRIMNDLNASYATESLFVYICAAIKRDFLLAPVYVNHFWELDQGSAGFEQERLKVIKAMGQSYSCYHTVSYAHRQIIDVVNDPAAIECGVGYEECLQVRPHDPSKFDENGYSTHPGLLPFIRDNFYVPESHFSYKNIKAEWIA